MILTIALIARANSTSLSGWFALVLVVSTSGVISHGCRLTVVAALLLLVVVGIAHVSTEIYVASEH